MTRKDYEAVARVIRVISKYNVEPVGEATMYDQAHYDGMSEAIEMFTTSMIRVFAADNGRFDAQRFREACKP